MKPVVAVVGGGMITHDQILPSLYQLQRTGIVGEIRVNARHADKLDALSSSKTIAAAFPGFSFKRAIGEYTEAIGGLPPRSIVIVALPDQLHYGAIMAALRANQHVCAVKPLVLKASESEDIERESRKRGLLVAVEYHKRFDDRSLMARQKYRAGRFGNFRLGTACLMEKWQYRHSNFQNWCTTEHSDAFTYIGCHYVDLVAFITGLVPTAVSVYGIRDKFPNGNEGFLWTDARVLWDNGAALNVQNSLSFPDEAPGSNTQGLTMYFGGEDGGAWLAHSDQYRGLQHSLLGGPYTEPSPDYFSYVEYGGEGLKPVGYGYRSIEAIVDACTRVESGAATLEQIDAAGIIATPANSRYNERLIEAARRSILSGGTFEQCSS
jgi:D-galacturonate reductase